VTLEAVFYYDGSEIQADNKPMTIGWYFWDETWTNAVGPYYTKTECDKAYEEYCEQL